MNAHTINLLDTCTNLIILLACILPVYILGLSHIIGDMPIIRSPMLKRSLNGKLQIITLRNPWTGKWLLSFTMSYQPTPIVVKPVQSPVAAFSNPYRFAMGMLIVWLLAACETPTNSTNEQDKGPKISTQYVADGFSLNKACWWPADMTDSLKVDGRKYIVSNRSRYRHADDLITNRQIDSLLNGDVWVNSWAFYRDTKRDDTIYVFNRCDMPDLGGD